MNTLKLKIYEDIPSNFTGIVEYDNKSKRWYKKGLLHRIDGPAIEWEDETKDWFLEGFFYHSMILDILFKYSIFLGTEKGKYNLYWLRFLTENEGIQEFPIIPGMESYKDFKEVFEILDKEIKTAPIP